MPNSNLGPVTEHTIVTQEQPRWRSWVLWTSLSSLLVYIVLQFFKIDLGEPVNRLLNLALPILVGLGLINNPDVDGVYINPDNPWYSNKSIWLAFAAFLAYVLQLVTGHNVDETVTTIFTLLVAVLTSYGIIKPDVSQTVDKIEKSTGL